MDKPVKLSLKQRAFIDYYLQTGNATESAKLAGYSSKTASMMGYENLNKPYIRAEIDERLRAIQDERIAKVDEIMIYLTSVMRREVKDHVPITVRNQELVPVHEGAEGKERITYKMVTNETIEVMELPTKVNDSNRAAELLGKRYKMWTDRIEQDIDGEIIVRMEGLEDLMK